MHETTSLKTVILQIAILLLSLVPIPAVQASPISYTLYGHATQGWGFTETSITSPGSALTAQSGETVQLTLIGTDPPTGHNFGVDYNGNGSPDVGEPLYPGPGEFNTFPSNSPQSYSFVATTVGGTYTYFCYIHRFKMFGNFVVATVSPDFTIASTPSPLTIQQGSSGTSNITLTSVNGFAGDIVLKPTVSPTGPAVSLSPTTVTLATGETKSAVLSISTTGTTPAGNYQVVVNGTSGQLFHTTSVSLTVQSAGSPPEQRPADNVLGLPRVVFYGVVAVIAAVAIGIAGVMAWRKGRGPKASVAGKP